MSKLSVADIFSQAHLSFVSRAYDYIEGVNVTRAQKDYIHYRLMDRLGVASHLPGGENLLAAYRALAEQHGLSESQILSRYLHDIKELERVTDEAVAERFPFVAPVAAAQALRAGDRRRSIRS